MNISALINTVWKELPEESLLIGGPRFTYPTGLYETLRVVDFTPAFLDAHLDRLFQGAGRVKMEIPYSRSEIIDQVIKVIQHFPKPDQQVRILVVPGQLIIYTTTLNYDPAVYQGVAAISVPVVRQNPEIKTTETEDSLRAWLKAQKEGCFEALLVSSDGTVYEGSRSNIFWVQGGKLMTRKGEVLPGTVRNLILEKTTLAVKFSHLNIHILDNVEEAFLTNSSSGIIPLMKLNEQSLPLPVPGHITIHLMKQYNRWLQEDIRKFRRKNNTYFQG